MPVKFEMHCHTAENDIVSKVSGAQMVKAYRNAGYDGIVITDHYFSLFFNWFSSELDGKTHHEIIDRYLKGYREAKKEGDKTGFTVLPGAEVRLDGNCINDYLLYGLTEQDFYELPLLNRLSSLEELRNTLPTEVMIVQAHPFRNGMTVIPPDYLDGVEVCNGLTEPVRNRLADEYASAYKLIKTAGSDVHKLEHTIAAGMIFEKGIESPYDLTSQLKSGSCKLFSSV